MATYNVERFCNELPATKPYVNFREPVAEAYFPQLDSGNASRVWAPRFDNTILHDVHRPGRDLHVLISDTETHRERIIAAIESQSIQQLDGSTLKLDEETGIDILGNLVEATAISINPVHYGDYHNNGHMLIAFAHDPEERHLQEHSVMGDTATAMRDPIFYRWHACIDELFTMYKDKLTPYKPDNLNFPDIYVSSVKLQSESDQDTNNTISTLWERSIMNLHNGLDFAPRRNVYARITHLQHEDFVFVIDVNNKSDQPQVGTVRIFLAPTVDETGRALSFEEQRKLVIEIDKFSEKLSPGRQTIRRRSLDSSVTIPFERIFRDSSTTATTDASILNFCDCGWPQHLLVPKGTAEGFPMVIFVMISNWKEDKVERDLTGANNDNASYCGLRDSKYPDRRAMGFPFDRKPAPGVDCLEKFLQPNMAVSNCTIKFTGRTQDRNQRPVIKPGTKLDGGDKKTPAPVQPPSGGDTNKPSPPSTETTPGVAGKGGQPEKKPDDKNDSCDHVGNNCEQNKCGRWGRGDRGPFHHGSHHGGCGHHGDHGHHRPHGWHGHCGPQGGPGHCGPHGHHHDHHHGRRC